MYGFSNAFMYPITLKFEGRLRTAYVVPFEKEKTHFPTLYEEVMKLREEGLSARRIAIKMRMKRGTVEEWIYKGGKPRGRNIGYVIQIKGKMYHLCDSRIEYLHPDWEMFTFPCGNAGYLLPSKMNYESDTFIKQQNARKNT